MIDLALLIEPKKVLKDQPNTYNGVTKNRDEVIARITVFKTQESLDKGEASEVLEDAKVVHGMLTSTLEKCVGGAIVAKVEKINTKNGGAGYVFRDVSAEAEKAVGVYYHEREAAVQSALAALGDDDFE